MEKATNNKKNTQPFDLNKITAKEVDALILQGRQADLEFFLARHESKNQINLDVRKKRKQDEYDRIHLEIASIFGVKSNLVYHNILICVQSIFGKNYTTDNINFIVDFLKENRPKDAIEAILLTQMWATHKISMDSVYRAGLEGQTQYGIEENMARITKFTKTYIAQMDALKRYRSIGEHKIVVEKVNVNDGGKAVIGSFEMQASNAKIIIMIDLHNF